MRSKARRLGYKAAEQSCSLRRVNFGFSFDDEKRVGVGVAGVAELLAGVVEGVGEYGEDDFAVGAADEVEAALVVDGLEWGRHFRKVRGCPRKSAAATFADTKISAIRSIHGIRCRIN